MKLQQGQQWNCGKAVLRIVRLERLAVEYKSTTDADAESTHHRATKKEFCRLVKGAALLPPTPPTR